MEYTFDDIKNARETLVANVQKMEDKKAIFRSVEMKALFDQLKTLAPDQRSQFGKEVNQLKIELESMITTIEEGEEQIVQLDVTAPIDVNVPSDKRPSILSSSFVQCTQYLQRWIEYVIFSTAWVLLLNRAVR